MTESQSSVQLSRLDGDIALVSLDMPGSSANILSDGMLTELQNCLDEIHRQTGLKGLVLMSAKPKIFVAGANLKEINAALDWPDEKIIEFANRGRKIYQAFGEFDFPSVAAIHGACVGGGLELALGCNRRIATSDKRTIIGLPETNLGLIPGWAGTVRVPRLTGLQKGLELIVHGKNVSSTEALELGLVDQIVDTPDDLLPASIQLLQSESVSGNFRQNASIKPVDVTPAELERISGAVQTPGFAQQVVKKHILSSCTLSFEAACDSEALAFAVTWGSEESRGLLNNFFLNEHNRKSPGFVDQSVDPQPIRLVGVVGAGLMGSGIAASCVKAGMRIKILDNDFAIAQSVENNLGGSEAGVQATECFEDFADCDLVIESITESLTAKLEILQNLESHCQSNTLLASNTSSIPISELAAGLAHPERFCGIHFCHPQLMKVVEVIRGRDTSEQTVASAVSFVRSLRKTPIAIKDGPGFVVNRVLSAMLNEAIHQLAAGNSIQDIDTAMREFGFAAGPFEIIDVIGADTCLKAGQIMGNRGITCVSDSPVVPRMVKRKRLGRKTLAGFYRYKATDADPQTDSEVNEILKDYFASKKRTDPTPFSDDTLNLGNPISTTILTAMYVEANRILEEQLVADERDIDLCLIHGLSFPAAKGGLLFWARRFGEDKIQKIADWIQGDSTRG